VKVVIVNCFDTFEDRIDLLHDFFIKKGYDVTIIQSNFRHFKKIHRTESKQDFIFVETKPYYKNMSLARVTSHYRYAMKAFKVVEEIKPDLLYVIVPPNSLAKFASEYKKKYSSVKLVFDLMDLWPETMPVGKIKDWPPFTFWRSMRDNSLKFADFVITECNFYQSIMKDVLKDLKTETVYLAKKEIEIDSHLVLNTNEIHLCYLGSINNIIDIREIKSLIKTIHEMKPITLHVIGDGESKDNLIDEINSTGATVKYHGTLYNPQEKQDVFDKCHFAINIMKDSVCVGLTMKSIDYFQHGLPILNNIKADTTEIVERYKVGFNVSHENIREVAHKVTNADMEELIEMRRRAKQVFLNLFSQKAFEKTMNAVLKEL
jgi:glycosyltransferase involved in cell wall biosynthesis